MTAGITIRLADGTDREFKAVEGYDPQTHGPRLELKGEFAVVIESQLSRRTTFPASAILEIIEQS